MITWVPCLFLLIAPSLAVTSRMSPPLSPCPIVLTYDEKDPITERSRWSANIEIRPEQPLRGFTLNIALDKPADILGNLVGEVSTRDNKHFSINTRKKLPAGRPFTIRIFVKHSSEVPFVKTIHLNGAQICPTEATYFQTEPRRALARPGESLVLLGRAAVPLRSCHFHMPPGDTMIDLSQGVDSLATNEYEYHGQGLEYGECGVRLKQVQDENDGVVECRVKPVEQGAEWLTSATTLRVTHMPVHSLPVFDIVPRKKNLTAGDNLTVICNADRPLNLCHFYLPGSRVLNLDLGPASEYTSEYRYHGDGLQYGHCGVTLTGVDQRLDGYLVCKLGRWPEQVTGAWETDAMKVQVTAGGGDFDWPDESPGTRPDGGGNQEPSESDGRRFKVTTTTITEDPDFPARPPKGNQLECGRAMLPPPVALVYNGQQTYHGEWPWHIALYQSTQTGGLMYICGGSLIGVRSVVTAAHCVTKTPFDRPVDPATLMVYLGRHHLKQWAENGLQERRVARIVVHPTYNRSGFNSDLAVLILKVVGWGIDERNVLSPELMKATMPVVSYVTCVMSKPQHFLEFLRNTTYCAGFKNGTSVCNGDSGGGMVFPIMTSRGRRWFLRGLVSNSVPRTSENFSTLVCDPQHYVVFTDVAQFLSWLSPFAV